MAETATQPVAKTEIRSIHNPAVPLTSSMILEYLGGGSRSRSGANVNAKTALSTSPVWQAVTLISGDISRLPWMTYKERADGGKTVAKEHPVYKLLKHRVNNRLTTNIWLSRMLGQALLYGEAFSLIRWRGSKVTGLHWLSKSQVEPWWEDGEFYYLVQYELNKDGRSDMARVSPDSMFHLQGLTLNEFGGLSLIDYARNAIGRHLTSEGWSDDFFANVAVPPGWFEHPGEMSAEAQERFLARVQNRHAGEGKRWRLGILEEGMKYNTAGVSPEDALLVEFLQWGVKDVARYFNIPPHKLGDDARVNYNSLEQENKAYFDSTLGQWVSRLECEANFKLFLDSEIDDGYYTEFSQDAWNKADTAARFQAYAIALNWGILSRNEVRVRENYNPYEGGDEYLTPLTHLPPEEPEDLEDLEDPKDPEDPKAEPENKPPAEAARSALRDVLRDQLESAARLLSNAAVRAAKREGNFLAAINGLEERHGAAVLGKIAAALDALGCERGTSERVASRIFGEAVDRMLAASECPADRLAVRVADAGEALRLYCGSLANELVYGR